MARRRRLRRLRRRGGRGVRPSVKDVGITCMQAAHHCTILLSEIKVSMTSGPAAKGCGTACTDIATNTFLSLHV